jgi:hexosaminidase
LCQAATVPAIVPLPKQMTNRPGVFTLCSGQPVPGVTAQPLLQILCDPSSIQNAQYLAGLLFRATGFQFTVATNSSPGPVRNAILLTTNSAMGSLGGEGYELSVYPDSALVRAPGQGGIFYGIQSFLQGLPPQIFSQQPVYGIQWTSPCFYVQDQPRFAWRGVMLDVSRHFVDKQEVERILDGLALHKINTFHWHLTDDHGWRIEIKSYPLLTATASTNTGAWRTGIDYGQNPAASSAFNSVGKYGGYYTQDDIREVVAYAQQRHITIVPELEFPAHCTAALVSYPNLGCGNSDDTTHYDMDNIHYGFTLFSLARPGGWTFFTNVLTEVMGLFPGPYIHCGGDEVVATGDSQWNSYSYDANQMTALGINPSGGSTARQQYQRWFTTNLVAFLQSNGRTMAGWSEIDALSTTTNAVLMEWETLNGNQHAMNGQPVVECPNGINYYEVAETQLYTNLEPYFQVGSSPSFKTLTNVYGFEPVPTSLGSAYASNIIGSQMNLWTEFVPSGLNVEYKIFPRMCAEAEVCWTPKAQKNWTDFTNRLVSAQQRLAAMGLNYNRETNAQVASWGPSYPTTATATNYDVTAYISKAGEIDVSFVYNSGSDGLNVFSVALLENGVQVDKNTFTGFAGLGVYGQTGNALGGVAYYALHLPIFHQGATYTLQVSMAEHGSANSTSGKVFLPNWN